MFCIHVLCMFITDLTFHSVFLEMEPMIVFSDDDVLG